MLWDTISWNVVTPTNTGVTFRIGYSSAAGGPYMLSPVLTNGSSLAAYNAYQYLVYYANLDTTDSAATPIVNDVTITSRAPLADLVITKTDGVTTATAGGSVTYTITASNAGPDDVTGATVADTFPASLTVTWTGVGSGGGTCTAAGAGNINDTVYLPSGGSVTYTASATISPSATGTLSNTATVSAPGGVTDPTPGNNSATDTDTLDAQADLSITKTDGVTTATPGGSVTYTITASNAGPSNVVGATVADTFPASLTTTWTAVGAGGGTATASGSGNINDTVNLPAGGSVTYTVSCAISPSASGTLSNTATVAAPGGVTDPTPGNNSATDTDTLDAQADLSITKTDGVTTATAGGSVTYTITASNAGPSNATGAIVADTFPAFLTATWTAVGAGGGTATASGSGNINDTVNLPAGGSVTYTVSCAISASASGTLSNTATVAAPGGVTDPTPGNNSATDSDTLGASADLSITKSDGVVAASPGSTVTYTITATNAGPSNATNATVADTLPASLTATWTAVGANGGTATAAGSGNINDTVNLPAGGSVTYTVTATISPSATGTLSNTATVTAPSGVTDPNPANNSSTDIDTLGPIAELSIIKTDGATTATHGGSVTYMITVANAGPSNATGATVTDMLPAAITGATWTSAGAGGGTGTASGTGNINDTVNLPAGGSVVYTVIASISATAAGTLTNTATITAPGTVLDPNPANNSSTDTDTLLNTSPVFASVPSATPNPAGINQAVLFTASATDAESDPLTYSWNFGDGTTGTGSSVSHAYAAAGSYTVTVTATDSIGAATSQTVAVTVTGSIPPLGVGDVDTDGDGFTDELEVALNSNPFSAASTPFPGNAPAGPAQNFSLPSNSLLIKLGLRRSLGSSIIMNGSLPVPAGISTVGGTIVFDVGGVIRQFTLDKNGKDSIGKGKNKSTLTLGNSARLGVSNVTFKLSVRGTDVGPNFVDEGLTGLNENKMVNVVVKILFNNTFFRESVPMRYFSDSKRLFATAQNK